MKKISIMKSLLVCAMLLLAVTSKAQSHGNRLSLGSLRIGASAGSDTHEVVGWANLGYEHNYVFRHGWQLYWQVKTDLCINGEDLFRTGIVLGIKLPTGSR